jgi:hypothetical protein
MTAADLGMGQSGTIRAEGLHASDIYNDLFQSLEPKRYVRDREPPPLLLEMGLIFERMLEEGILRRIEAWPVTVERVERPGEFTESGTFEGEPFTIHFTPDLLIFNGDLRVGEIKATKMSPGVSLEVIDAYLRREDEAIDAVGQALRAQKFDKYWVQVKLYCHLLHTRYARLYAFFINGVYKPTMDPVFLACDATFSEDDLAMNFAMCMNHARFKRML